MPRINPLSLSRLNQGSSSSQQQPTTNRPSTPTTPTEGTYAYLEREDGQGRYDFMLNPSSIEISTGANFETISASGVNVPRIMYRFGEAQTLTLNGLIWVVPGFSTSLLPLLNDAVNLTRCNPESKVFTSPVLSFIWGSRRFEPCIVTKVSFKETMWTPDGYPAMAEGSLTLLEVPDGLPSSTTVTENQGTTPTSTVLTDRQKNDGSSGALEWLRKNTAKLPKDLQQRVKQSKFKLSTDDKGSVSMLDEKGKSLKVIGKNNRGKFEPAL